MLDKEKITLEKESFYNNYNEITAKISNLYNSFKLKVEANNNEASKGYGKLKSTFTNF